MVRARQALFSRHNLLLLVATVIFWHCTAAAGQPSSPGGKALLAKYPAIKMKLEKNQFGMPVYVESTEQKSSLFVDVYGIFNYPFSTVRDALQSPANWCDIASLHINIKACTFRKTADQRLLTLYSGRKYYQSPNDAYPLTFQFHIAAQQPEYLNIALAAKEGPLFTRDHRIMLEAAPLDKGSTFVRFSYAYSYGSLARTAIKTYFATIARDKVGFSIVADKTGKPVYIRGVRGAVERNAVRYYLALQTYMDTLDVQGDPQFDKRISRWYELTARFPRQLYEVGKEEYVAGKRREHDNQRILQQEAGN